jgi:hypothetical protein
MRRPLVLVVTMMLAGASAAPGALLCQKPSGALFAREACKRKETAVDPAALGLVGRKGDAGYARRAGRGARLRVRGRLSGRNARRAMCRTGDEERHQRREEHGERWHHLLRAPDPGIGMDFELRRLGVSIAVM